MSDQVGTTTVQCPSCKKQFDVTPDDRGVFMLPVHSGRILKTCMAGGKEYEIVGEGKS